MHISALWRTPKADRRNDARNGRGRPAMIPRVGGKCAPPPPGDRRLEPSGVAEVARLPAVGCSGSRQASGGGCSEVWRLPLHPTAKRSGARGASCLDSQAGSGQIHTQDRQVVRSRRPPEPAMPATQVTIVIPGDDPPQLQGSPHLQRLRAHGEVILHTDRPATAEEKICRARGATCLINSRGAVKWPGEVLRQLPGLKLIATCGIGTDSIDLEEARALGIAVCHIPGRTAPLVAEHALALMLGAARRAWFQTDAVKRGRWL